MVLARFDNPVVAEEGRAAQQLAMCCGRFLASGGTDACISLWDVTDMVCVRTLVGMDNEVTNVSFSPNSKYLAYLDHKLGVCIADVDSGAAISWWARTCWQLPAPASNDKLQSAYLGSSP